MFLIVLYFCKIDRCTGDDEAWRETAPGSQKCCLERHEQAVLDSI